MLAQISRRGIAKTLFGSAAALASASFGIANLSTDASVEVLSPEEWRPLKLVAKEKLTAGDRPTYLLRFEVSKGQEALPVASCLLTRAPVGSEKEDGTRAFVMRPYTPVSAPDAKHLDLAVKIYPDGKLTPHLATMKPGDVLDFKGPIVKLPVAQAAQKKAIGLIAGGTGITPMLQLAEELLRQRYANPIKLIYANVSPADIMMKDRVDALAASHPNFSVHYIVDKAPPAKASWTGGVGYVTAEMLKEHMPGPSEDVLLCVCGPPGMMNIVSGSKVSPKDQGPLIGYLKDLGYSETNVIKF